MITPHNDVILQNNHVVVPAVTSVINVAIVGELKNVKGCNIFLDLANRIILWKNLKVIYHVFGKISVRLLSKKEFSTVVYHGSYKDDNIALLHKSNIHVLTLFSLQAEIYSYSYALSSALRSGLSIVYLKRGSYISRLKSVENAFGTTNIFDLEVALMQAFDFVLSTQNTTFFFPVSNNVQPTKWYLLNYPLQII